jgi:hypothetical protein
MPYIYIHGQMFKIKKYVQCELCQKDIFFLSL